MERTNVCKFNQNRSSDLICLSFIKEANDAQSSPQHAKHHALHLVIGGSGTFTHNGKAHEIKKGSLFFVCEGDTFSIVSQGSLEYYYISFHGRRADELILRFGVDSEKNVFEGYEALIPFWSECQELAVDSNIDIVCEAALLYSLAKLSPEKKEKNDVISRVISLTQDNFTDPDVSISSLARELGYDQKYLSSLFKKKKGIPYTQYLRELRVRHAIFLMEEGVVSVKNVAILSGFRDALYFSKIFTSAVGESPSAYIARLTANENGKV